METMLSFFATMSPVRPAADTPYGQAYAAGRRAVRRLVLDAASRLLEAEGPDALTMRRIAGEVGCSTSVLYTMFGGKAGVAEGLWREGFERLRGAMERVADDDPLGRLAALGRVYRENALANRAYYAIMFQRPIPGFRPSPEAYAESLQPLRILVDAAADCIRAGVFRDADPARVAGVLWGVAPGAVSPGLAGYEGAVDAEARFQELMAAAATWFMARR
jgi:AcrR family transcriptional regulator